MWLILQWNADNSTIGYIQVLISSNLQNQPNEMNQEQKFAQNTE